MAGYSEVTPVHFWAGIAGGAAKSDPIGKQFSRCDPWKACPNWYDTSGKLALTPLERQFQSLTPLENVSGTPPREFPFHTPVWVKNEIAQCHIKLISILCMQCCLCGINKYLVD